MSHWINDVSLTGNSVELVPLTMEHRDALVTAASDGELWNLWYTAVPSPETIDQTIEQALAKKSQFGELPFVIKDVKSNQIIGSTRFCNVDNVNKRLEIGYTWYAKSFQRTNSNTEAKLLLLSHAFEVLQSIAVEFRTNWFNHQSRSAILRLGAKQDGVLRNHQRMTDGGYRDTVVFSIIDSEWLAVKRSLMSKTDVH